MDKDILLFKAAYYANLDDFKKMIGKKDDLIIRIPTPSGSYDSYWENKEVKVNLLDILNWSNYAYYEWFERELLTQSSIDKNGIISHEISFNASLFYRKIIDCIEWICNEFKIVDNYRLKDYSQYRALRHFFDADENWLDENDMHNYLAEGYRKIDLDLINEAEKGNGIAVCHLMKAGANPDIDPIDKDPEISCVLDMHESASGINLAECIGYICDESGFDKKDCYHMLSCLYQSGISQYVLDIINFSGKQ